MSHIVVSVLEVASLIFCVWDLMMHPQRISIGHRKRVFL